VSRAAYGAAEDDRAANPAVRLGSPAPAGAGTQLRFAEAPLFGSVGDLVAEYTRHGRFRDVDPAAAQGIWASAHRMTSLLLAYPGFPWAERAPRAREGRPFRQSGDVQRPLGRSERGGRRLPSIAGIGPYCCGKLLR